jgi:hypothetical protein
VCRTVSLSDGISIFCFEKGLVSIFEKGKSVFFWCLTSLGSSTLNLEDSGPHWMTTKIQSHVFMAHLPESLLEDNLCRFRF